MFVGEHADLLQALVRAPKDQRNAMLVHRELHREHWLPCKAVPVQAAQLLASVARVICHKRLRAVADLQSPNCS